MSYKKPSEAELAKIILRLGLAFVFVYAAISSLKTPDAWLYFVPHFITHIVSADLFLKLFSIFQLLLATALLLGKYVRYAAILAALSLAGLVVFNTGALLITFRDVGLAAMAVGLALLED